MTEEPATGILTLVCAATGAEVSTGVVYSQSDLQRTHRAQLYLDCPSCGIQHVFSFSDAYLKPVTH